MICCSGSSSDVTNILVSCFEQQFPLNWKTPRPFRQWCYLAAFSPSWPSMKDEPLYISSLSLRIEPRLHHHSNGCLAYTPRDVVIPQIAWKNEIVCVPADFEALRMCVCVDADLCSFWFRLHLSAWIIDQGCHGIYDKGWRVSQPHTWALSSILDRVETTLRQPAPQQTVQMTACLSFQTIYHFTATLQVPWLQPFQCLLHPAPKCFIPHSLLSLTPGLCPHLLVPQRRPFLHTVSCLLLRYFITSFSRSSSLTGGLQWIFITQRVNLHYGVLCVVSLVRTHIAAHIHTSSFGGFYNLNTAR